MNVSGALAILWVFVEPLLKRIANELWDGLWEQIILAIQAAEAKWAEAGRGEAKKAEVVATAMAYITERAKLNWLQLQLVKLFVSRTVDAIIAELNEQIGQDWGQKAKAFERQLADRLPAIE